MRAEEVLERYADGERDFRHVDLRGQSFSAQDLSGADFSHADIRGTNFRDATLKETNFTEARAGLDPLWLPSAMAVIILFTLSVASGSIVIILFAIAVLAVVVFGVVHKKVHKFQVSFSTFTIILVIISLVALILSTTVYKLLTRHIPFQVIISSLLCLCLGVMGTAIVIFVGSSTGIVSTAITNLQSGRGSGFLLLSLALVDELLKAAIQLTGGTNFRVANLTEACFEDAMLENTAFLGANLMRVRWTNAKKLDRANSGGTILADSGVRDLLTTQQGSKKDYSGKNFRGANLMGANLFQANLTEADLSGALLEGANLEQANLSRVQALGTNFRNACLTGVCIEAWNIDHTTKLEEVDCQYVFLLEQPNTLGSRERRPHDPDRVFQPGDFEKLYQQVINTVQFLLRNGINREAFAEAFEKLMQDHPGIDYGSIQSVERKGNDVLLTLEVPEKADKEKIAQDFLKPYEERVQQLEAKVDKLQTLHSTDLKDIALALATRPIDVNNNNISMVDNKPDSETYNTDLREANIANFANKMQDQARQQANQHNYASEQKQTLAEAAKEIQDLLKQLEASNPTATESDKQKFVTMAIASTRRQRFIGALDAGWKEAIKELLDNPYLNVAIAILEGWKNV